MQLIVLGMHRSGTSAVCRILNMMGAYFGPEGSSTGFNAENPKGFWERKDIRKMNDSALFEAKADWYKVADFSYTIIPDQMKEQYTDTARSLVHELDAHRPWVIKEPRLCLLLPLFLPILEVPVCIHVYRNPLQVAQSLNSRNGFPLNFGIALWEKYTLSALSNTRGLSNVLISYAGLIERPVETVRNLFEELVSMGIQGLKCPINKEINAFIDKSLFRERDDPNLVKKEYLNYAQVKLFQSLENNSVFNYKKFPTLSSGALDVLRDFEAQDEKIRELLKSISVIEERHQNLYKHSGWIEQMNMGISAILSSRCWRFGKTAGELVRRIMFKAKVPRR